MQQAVDKSFIELRKWTARLRVQQNKMVCIEFVQFCCDDGE